MDTLANNVAAYETLAQKIEALNKAYDETPYANDGLEDYEVYLDEVLQAGYDNGTFDIAELDSVQPRADRIFRESVMKALADGTTDNVTGLMVNPNFAGSNDGWTKTGDGIGKSIRKSAACPKDRIRLPCRGSIPRVPEMITHGMKVGGRKATRRTRFWVTFSVTMLLNPFSMLQRVRRRRTWLKTVRK